MSKTHLLQTIKIFIYVLHVFFFLNGIANENNATDINMLSTLTIRSVYVSLYGGHLFHSSYK